ncbi:CHASE2 domain-containing protein [Okeania sp. KiyG1]|uniref:CHASE2 domain-containing protein n=1 Tax=Okeania sp. KiyG1 TaxID=2720165 RepID=UPI00192402DC|nr:adenylate/guanylate cyclase domain-containing protein [Okeania sp. KiyG1]GGA32716.1 adenylate/guanylate cyclase domain-containing protein [Okeania sp. KiyG1]
MKEWKKTIKNLAWKWRCVLVTVPSITVLLIGLNLTGSLQIFEFAAFDQLTRLRPQKPVDRRFLIVGLTESDIQKLGTTILSDELLANLIENLKKYHPAVIGLDIYRDLPEEPGYEKLVKVFESTPNLIGIKKVVGNHNDSPINPSPILDKFNQVAANDLPMDADSKIRRFFLYLTDQEGKIVPSLGLKLATIYLENFNIFPKPSVVNSEYLQLGKAVFVPFEKNHGAYVRANAEGYQAILNYRSPENTFQQVSVTDVLNNHISPELVRGRIILIGSVAESKNDLFLTPYSSKIIGIPEKMSGVEIHANITSMIISSALGEINLIKIWPEYLEYLWIFSWSTLGASISWKWRYSGGFSQFSGESIIGLFAASAGLVCIRYYGFLWGFWIPIIPPLLAIWLSAIAITAFIAKTAGYIREVFSRYLTDEIVANLLENPDGLNLDCQRRKVTILISDIRGFSAISERSEPEIIFSILNIYLARMTEIINEYGGTIDEFIGDAILVIFGAPTQKDDDAERAVACAVAMQMGIYDVNAKLKDLSLPEVQMGIGINTGEVAVGNIGGNKRSKYGVVGSNINLASRIESYTLGGQILISKNTLEAVTSIVQIVEQKSVKIKGFAEAITIYQVIGIAGKYNLFLPAISEKFVALSQAVPIQFAVVDGKEVSKKLISGSFVKVSASCAEVKSDYLVNSMSNLEIHLLNGNLQQEKMDYIYAKVTGEKEDRSGFYIHFTAVSPEVENILQTWVTANS